MPEEIEVPTEQLHETLHEEAEGQGGHGEGGPSWVGKVALSAAIIAVLAAVAALSASHHANEAMLEQMQATDSWAYYQAKGIKASLVETKVELLTALSKEPVDAERKKIDKYKDEQKEIEDKAHELERSSEEHMHRHVVFARSVTTFQIAIALSAIAVLSRKKLLWYVGLLLSLIGVLMLGQAFL
jgi:hypothetical protein